MKKVIGFIRGNPAITILVLALAALIVQHNKTVRAMGDLETSASAMSAEIYELRKEAKLLPDAMTIDVVDHERTDRVTAACSMDLTSGESFLMFVHSSKTPAEYSCTILQKEFLK